MALSSASPCGPFTLPRLSVIFALLCVTYLIRDIWLPASPSTSISTQGNLSPAATELLHASKPLSASEGSLTNEDQKNVHHEECYSVPGADKVMVILKTGATEIYGKLPIQLVTLFRCTPHYLIFSDLAQSFSDYTIHDALDTVRSNYKDNHEDFELYRTLQKYHREGQNPSKLKGGKGWNLDKWKFMPMLHETYRLAPKEVDWFVYIEADTSLSWPNLLQWLQTLNRKKALYMGSQNYIGETAFAHGGSGFIISRAAAKKMEDHRQKEGPEAYDEKWASLTSMACCGDEIIARALVEAGVSLTPSWPLIQGETVSTLDWTKKHWCTPAVSWHHVSPAQVDEYWQYQMEWVKDHGWSAPYLYKDVFDAFVSRHISVNRTAWNNLSKDTSYVKPGSPGADETDGAKFDQLSELEKQSVESFEGCAQICRAKKDCIQYMFEPGRCHLGNDIRLGETDEREQEHWSSGWLLDRIADMRAGLEPCAIKFAV